MSIWRPGLSLKDVEDHAILAALAHCGGNRTKAAEELRVDPRTLFRKIAQLKRRGFEVPKVMAPAPVGD